MIGKITWAYARKSFKIIFCTNKCTPMMKNDEGFSTVTTNTDIDLTIKTDEDVCLDSW